MTLALFLAYRCISRRTAPTTSTSEDIFSEIHEVSENLKSLYSMEVITYVYMYGRQEGGKAGRKVER